MYYTIFSIGIYCFRKFGGSCLDNKAALSEASFLLGWFFFFGMAFTFFCFEYTTSIPATKTITVSVICVGMCSKDGSNQFMYVFVWVWDVIGRDEKGSDAIS